LWKEEGSGYRVQVSDGSGKAGGFVRVKMGEASLEYVLVVVSGRSCGRWWEKEIFMFFCCKKFIILVVE